MKKILMRLLSLMIVISFVMQFVQAISVDDTEKLTFEEIEKNNMESNKMIERFQLFFEGPFPDPNGCAYPDYFGGFYVLPNGKLLIYVTSASEKVLSEITDVVGSDHYVVQRVKYSFAELFETKNEIKENQLRSVVRVSIDLPENCINVFCETEENGIRETKQALSQYGDIIAIKPFISIEQAVADSFLDNVIPELPMREETDTIDSFPVDQVSAVLSNTVYPGGLGVALATNGGHVEGTISACVYNPATGLKFAITHGHNVSAGLSYYTSTAVLNTSTLVGTVLYSSAQAGNNPHNDFSIVPLNSGVSASNYISGTIGYITSAYGTEAALESVNGALGYFKGYVSGEQSGYISCYDGDLMLSGVGSIGGDSGAPIYTKTSSNSFRYAGIQDANHGNSWVEGTTFAKVKSYFTSNYVDIGIYTGQ